MSSSVQHGAVPWPRGLSGRLGAAVLVLLFGVCASLVLPAGAAHAAFPGKNGVIAYEAVKWTSNGPTFQVHTVKPDGTGQKVIAKNGFEPAWRPDGKKLAFVGEVSGVPQIFIMNADGSRKKQITSFQGGAAQPAWAPNGKTLVFIRLKGGWEPNGIWRMNVDGANLKRLVRGTDSNGMPIWPTSPAWSPDGKKIAFERISWNGDQPRDEAIHVINRDGSGSKRLTPWGGFMGPNWSPDSKRLVYFEGNSGCAEQILVMKADGSGKRQVIDTPCLDADPAWSPNGARIVFLSSGPGFPDQVKEGLYTVKPDGTGLRYLKVDGMMPDWQPRP